MGDKGLQKLDIIQSDMAALKDVMVIDILDALNRRDDKMQKL